MIPGTTRAVAPLFLSSAREKGKPCVGSRPSASSGAPSQIGSLKPAAPKPRHEDDKLQHACTSGKEIGTQSNGVIQIKVYN